MSKTTTYLSLCQQASRDMGLQGGGMASTVSRQGMNQRIVEWVRDSWVDVQMLRQDWLFMDVPFTLDVATTMKEYALGLAGLANISMVKTTLATAYKNSEGKVAEAILPYEQSFDKYLKTYDIGDKPAGKLAGYTIAPSGNLIVFPTPDTNYTIRGRGRSTIQTLSLDADIINLHDEYTDIIKWAAVMKFASDQEAPSLYQASKVEYDRILAFMSMTQLPKIQAYVRPLA